MRLIRPSLGSLAIIILVAAPAAAQYTRVSVAVGGAPADGAHGPAAISADGRFVAFASEATNLIASDANASTDVFVRDLVAATTERVSLAQDGLERSGRSGASGVLPSELFAWRELDISADGRFVVFTSRAALVPGDAATCVVPPETAPGNCPDIYLRDRQANQTVRLSVPTGGGEADGPSGHPRISADGRWVAFDSAATNLVAGDTNGVSDVFLLDRQTGALTRVSVSSGGVQGDLPSVLPSISGDGGVIAFASAATVLSAEPDPVVCERAPPACTRPFLVDRASGVTRRLPMPAFNTRPNPGPGGSSFRVDVASLNVAPDGASVAGGMTAIAPRLGLSVPAYAYGWIYDRGLDRLTTGAFGAPGGWDGRFLPIRQFFITSVPFGTIEGVDTITGLTERVGQSSQEFPDVGNSAASGRYLVLSTKEAKIAGDTDEATDIYVLDRDPDADGLPTSWETFFGLDPAVADGSADPDLDGVSNLAEFTRGSHPTAQHTRYLAEGASNAFFSTEFAVANPGVTDTTTVMRYLGDNGRTWSSTFTSYARSRQTIFPSGLRASSFSTVIESTQPVVVDRTMTWGGGYGSHAETSMAAPATTWFLAEGATHGSFNLFYLLQNPGTAPATVDVTYLRPAPAPPITRQYTVPAASRLTIAVDAIAALAAADVSASLVSDVPILVERSMYMDTVNPAQVFGAGHAGAGVTAANTRWFLAEGATGSFFDLYYLIANPSTQPTTARVTYLLPTGAPIVKDYAVPAQSRLTISVDGEDPRLADTPVSAIIESTTAVGLVVERSMWWPGQGQWQEGHLAAGSTVVARRWALAAGAVGPGVETYVLIANTSNTAGTATLTSLPASGGNPAVLTATVPIPANSRVSVPMSQFPVLATPLGSSFGMIVESDGPDIVVERAMYTDFNGIVWAAGTAALGTPLP